MSNKFLLFVLKDLFINPIKAWETIDSENNPVSTIRNSFLFPLIFLVSVSAVAGSAFYTNSQLSLIYSLFVGIKCFALFFVTVYATAYILKEITYPLDLGRNFVISFRLIIYSIVPFLLCQVLSRLFESLLFINVLALFGLYIFWTGTEKILTPPAYKKMPLLIAAMVTFVVIYIATDLLFTMLFDRVFHKFLA